MTDALTIDAFRSAFEEAVKSDDLAGPLKAASDASSLNAWTQAMTAASVGACKRLGIDASAKWHKSELLPIHRSEYLALDVFAFSAGLKRWRFPAIVMELENSQREDQIAYSLWKVLCVRAGLRIVFCYRRNSDKVPALMRHLREEVIDAMSLDKRLTTDGETLVVVGSRSEAETFPFGYFQWWVLDTNLGKFERA